MVEMDRNYPGAPLVGASSIQLLEILQSDREEQIECTLSTVDLDSQPKSFALSYTWGNDLHSFGERSTNTLTHDEVHEIVVNDRPFVVSENLFDALQD